MGGAAQANFGPLINLIQSTIDGNWERDGGNDSIVPFQSILSLVVAASQETHEEIAALLNNLRAQQNLQVTIEVRFMTLSDVFFERIGVDFSIGFDNNANSIPPEDGGRSTVIGLTALNPLTPTTDLDVRFLQSSFGSTPPPFGAPDQSGGRFGVAILSDIEMFFFWKQLKGFAYERVASTEGHHVRRSNSEHHRCREPTIRARLDSSGRRLRRRPATDHRGAERRYESHRAIRSLCG